MRALSTALILATATPVFAAEEHQAHGQEQKTGMEHEMMEAMMGPLNISSRATDPGTSWLPDATPMYAVHAMKGPWLLMLHGNTFLQYIDEGGDRGDEDSGSINWVMGMARRKVADEDLMLRAMLSAEPETVGECGYADLLAPGDTRPGIAHRLTVPEARQLLGR